MIGEDDDQVALGQHVFRQRHAFHRQPVIAELGDVRIMVDDLGAVFLQ